MSIQAKAPSLRTAVACLLLVCCTSGFCEDELGRWAASISEAELRDHLFFLAADALEGRMTGSRGYRIAAHYAASQLRAAGLEPLPERQGYFLDVPFVSWSFDQGNVIQIDTPGSRLDLKPGDGFLLPPAGAGGRFETESIRAVYVGYGISEPGDGWDDYSGLETRDKAAVALLNMPIFDGEPIFPPTCATNYYNITEAIATRLRAAAEHGAKVLLLIPDSYTIVNWRPLHAKFSDDGISYSPGNPVGASHHIAAVILSKDVAQELFRGQKVDAFAFMKDHKRKLYSRGELEDVSVSARLGFQRISRFAPNVAAYVPGSDGQLKDEFVILGAHLDHIGMRGDEACNGADDNASGCSALMEIAEAVASHPPRRSVAFVLFSGEEMGLIGSRHLTDNSPIPMEQVVFVLNMDMIGRYEHRPSGSGNIFVIGSDRVCERPRSILVETNRRTVNLPLAFGADLFFSSSDSFSFHEKGVPTAFLFDGIHSDFHSPGDDAEKIDYPGLRSVAQLAYYVVMEIAERDERPCLRVR